MTESEIEALFDGISIWKRGDQRAPHKPLLLLMTLARIQQGESPLASFVSIEPKLKQLLIEFGPNRVSYHPANPFWRLQNDGDLWVIPQLDAILNTPNSLNKSGDVRVSELRRHNAEGGLNPVIDKYLRTQPELLEKLAHKILSAHFPESYFQELLDTVGMTLGSKPKRSKRDPRFRKNILRVYEYCCAVCGYNGKLGTSAVGIEAAHIKWHAYGGPDTINNGVALCSFHHKMLDRGAMGFNDNFLIDVSQEVHGGQKVNDLLLQYVGKKLAPPQSGLERPLLRFVSWHRKEVFREPGRLTS
jgi:putative restriction endonuclease